MFRQVNPLVVPVPHRAPQYYSCFLFPVAVAVSCISVHLYLETGGDGNSCNCFRGARTKLIGAVIVLPFRHNAG
jgi:hypothetical protein